MKRLHVHVAVENLTASIRFYSQLFAARPVVHKEDYAKWMLEDPRVNFAISRRGAKPGIEHLGIQVEDRAELEEVYGRIRGAQGPVLEEGKTTCCYAKSEKSWIEDPQGIQWETFLTSGESTVYGGDAVRASPSEAAACKCSPAKVSSGERGSTSSIPQQTSHPGSGLMSQVRELASSGNISPGKVHSNEIIS